LFIIISTEAASLLLLLRIYRQVFFLFAASFLYIVVSFPRRKRKVAKQSKTQRESNRGATAARQGSVESSRVVLPEINQSIDRPTTTTSMLLLYSRRTNWTNGGCKPTTQQPY